MKRIYTAVAVVLILASIALAASSVTQTYDSVSADLSVLEYSWTADTDGSISNAVSTRYIEGYIVLVETDPGATAPTAAYDIELLSNDGSDLMGGQLADRSATDAEAEVAKIGGDVYGPRLVNSNITLSITNNSVNSATGIVRIFIAQ